MDSTIVIDPKQQPHHHTIIWIHGLAEGPQRHVEHFGGEAFRKCRIVLPSADVRPVTIMKKEVVSWYDIKFRSEKSFLVDFDEAFSSAEVHDSFQK
jgi:predicted esterase